jgi:hypothetical protein
MKTAEKLASGWLLTLGFMFLSISASAVLEKNAIQNSPKPLPDEMEYVKDFPVSPSYYEATNNPAMGGFVFGFPTAILGGWLALSLYRQNKHEKKALQQEMSDRLQSVFYRMIQENHGRVTLLGFAMQSQLPPGTAKEYLDSRAKEFNANFKISEEGSVSYLFDI